MTPEERDLIMSLVVVPGRQHEDHREAVLQHFGESDGKALGLALLNDAFVRQDGVDVEMALIVSNTFGLTQDHVSPLVALSAAKWHQKHEDIAASLGQLRNPTAIGALYQATQWVPDYLDFDESRALARKAIWAIGSTQGDEATEALNRLLESDDEIVREEAERQIRRR